MALASNRTPASDLDDTEAIRIRLEATRTIGRIIREMQGRGELMSQKNRQGG